MRSRKVFFCGLVLTAAMFLRFSEAKADLITNGGFETGDFTGWTTGANSYPETVVTTPNSGSFAAQIAGFSANPDTLSQTISTSAGQSYDLSFWRSITGTTPTQSLTVSWDGVQNFSELNPGAQVYQEFTLNVLGTGNDTLLFTCANDPGFTYLDDVALIATPEPSTETLLFGSGAICLAILAIRRFR